MNGNKILKILLALVILSSIICFFYFDLGQFLSFEYLKTQQSQFQSYYEQNRILTLGAYFLVYVLVTALSLPGATVITLAGGLLFGVIAGTMIVSISSTVGATLAFLSSRFLLRDSVQKKFSKKLKPINEGFEKEGAFYLLSLRLIPLFPFFMINLVMGLLPIRTWKYFVVSMLGMFPGTVAYVNAGTQLGKIESLKDIASVELLLSFALLGVIPLFAKKFITLVRTRKLYKPFKKPKSYDFNLVVIGAGAAGLVSSYIASTLKSKVALIEKHKMGGDCLNTGCVPSKALIKTAKILHQTRTAEKYGLKPQELEFEFQNVMARVHKIIAAIEPHDSIERYTNLGVDCIQGEAKIRSPYEIQVNGKTITTKAIIVATGASPIVPKLPGLETITPLTSENLWELKSLPKRLIVLGGGPIGCELAQSFQRLGSQVIQIEMGQRLLPKEDLDISEAIQSQFKKEGVDLKLEHQATAIKDKNLICKTSHGEEVSIAFDEILFAVGRKANVKGFGLEELGVEIAPQGTLATNEFLATNFPNIFTCGDVAGPYQFTHTAAHQAYYASINALFHPIPGWVPPPFNKSFKVNHSVIPWATYTDPEIATVGLTELSAQAAEIEYDLTTYGIDDLDRAIADDEATGFIKVLTEKGNDRILGATIVSSKASDMITEFISAMKNGFGLNSILGTIHIYPTMSEANKFAAGNWKRARKPEGALKKLEKFFQWRRQ